MVSSISSEYNKSNQSSWLGTSCVSFFDHFQGSEDPQVSSRDMYFHPSLRASLSRHGETRSEPDCSSFCWYRNAVLRVVDESGDAHCCTFRELIGA